MSQEESFSFNRVTIVGPGLLGASMGMVLREKGVAREIWAHLRDPKKEEICKNTNWCDHATTDLKAAVAKSDLVVLCTPVETIIKQLAELATIMKSRSLVTDVGSLKRDICYYAEELFKDNESCFIGSHPMAGSEKEGMQFATSHLFENKKCMITPFGQENQQQCKRLINFWESLGMSVIKMNPAEHDEIVGWVSHLPHITATSLMNSLSKKNKKWMNLSGNGLKDTTRIACGNPDMWTQIISGNKDNLIEGINTLVSQLNAVKDALDSDDNGELLNLLELAKRRREILNTDG